MDFLYPLASIVAETAGKTVDKLNFARTKISARQMMLIAFVIMSASISIFVLITKQPLPNLTLVSFSLILLIGMVSFASNIFDELSLKADDLSLREPLKDFEPILAGLIGFMLFPTERKPVFLVVFILAIFVVYYGSHRRKLRKFQVKGMHFLLLATVFEAILPSIFNVTLQYITPTYLAFFRITGVLLFSLLFFPLRKTLKNLTVTRIKYLVASGVVYTVGAVTSLYAISVLGVAQTMLLMLIGPSLKYLSAYFILKEKVRTGEVVSSLLLTGLVLMVVLI